jgi:hypothetical protein
MKLECPSCHQKYRLTNRTIPANYTVVTCRVCTKPIPLKGAADPSDPPGHSHQLVTCGYCGKKVSVGAVQATESKRIPCPHCQHPVIISPQLAKASTSTKPAFEGVHLECGQCGQTYTLNRAKIPANAASASCKACGNKIPIPGSLAKHHDPDTGLEDAQASPARTTTPAEVFIDDVETGSSQMASATTTKKTWYRAFISLMLAALIGFGIWFGGGWLLDMFKTGWEVLIESKPRPTMKTPSGTFSTKPLVAARLNTPLVMHAITGRISPNSPHHKTIAALKAVGLQRVEVFMLPQSELLVVPALYIQGREIKHLEKLIAGYNLIERAVQKAGPGLYVVDLEALGQKYGKDLPGIPYAIWFHQRNILVAPEVLMKDPQVTLERITGSRISGFAGALSSPRQAGTVAVEIPNTLESDWPLKLKQNPVLKADPRLAMTTRMGTSVLIQLGDALRYIDMIGGNLAVTGKHRQRTFNYRQRFRSRSTAKRFTTQLEAADDQATSAEWLVREMLSLFSDNRIEYSFKLDSKDLNVAVKWLPDQDQLIMNALIRAMFGKIVDTATSTVASLSPTSGNIETIPMDMPEVLLELDPEQVRRDIGPDIQECLFPGQYWDGAEPRMTVDVDTIPFANNALAKITYQVLKVTSKDGRDIHRRSEQVIEHTIQPGEPVPGFVAIDVQPGTPAESLESADIRFHFTVPTRLNELHFSLADPLETTRVAGNIPVRLMRLEKDVVEIGFKDNPGLFMFAFDRTGVALRVSESTESSRRITRRYHGQIHHIKVLVVEKQLEMPIELSVNLNGGRPYTLSHQPETPTRTRFDHSALTTYKSFNTGHINQLKVQWHEASESEWHDRLSVALPHGPFHGQTEWDVHFFGPESPVTLSGKPTHTHSRMNYTLEKGALRKVNAVTGQVRMRLETNIQRQQFVKTSDRTPVIQKLPSGKIVTVIFDRNEVTLTPFDETTVHIIAYDADNRRLRRDAYAQTMGLMRKYYYWGIPARVEVDIADNQLKKSIDFDIVKRPVNQKAYDAFKQRLSSQKEVAAALKQIHAARKQDHNRYGDDLAGLYYVYARKKKVPMQLIDEAVAHADPAGEKRFGYPLQPHRGYYFTVLAGKELNGSRREFPRNRRAISVNWEKGVIKATNYRELPTIAAIPVDKSQPTFFLQSGRVFMKSLNGEEFTYLPEDFLNSGWVEVGASGG